MELVITKNKARLKELETVIDRNLQSFYEVGRALMEIRDQELYKLKNGGFYQTFEAYCKGTWSLARSTAYQFIDSAKIIENVRNCGQTPQTESQTRPLARLNPAQQKEAWQKAVSTAPAGKVTAAHVEKVVREISPKEEIIPEQAVYFAKLAIYQLERINKDDPTKETAFLMVESWIKNERRK